MLRKARSVLLQDVCSSVRLQCSAFVTKGRNFVAVIRHSDRGSVLMELYEAVMNLDATFRPNSISTVS